MGLIRGIPHSTQIPLLRQAWECKCAALQLSLSAPGDPWEPCSACREGVLRAAATPLLVLYDPFPLLGHGDHTELPCGLEGVMGLSGCVPKAALPSKGLVPPGREVQLSLMVALMAWLGDGADQD